MVLITGWERLGMESVFVSSDSLVILKFMYFPLQSFSLYRAFRHYFNLRNFNLHFFLYVGSEIDPELLLAVFLPALLFESSFSMEVHQIKVSFLGFFYKYELLFELLSDHVILLWLMPVLVSHMFACLCTSSFNLLCILYEILPTTYKEFLHALVRFLV
jgi:hypothetical protein